MGQRVRKEIAHGKGINMLVALRRGLLLTTVSFLVLHATAQAKPIVVPADTAPDAHAIEYGLIAALIAVVVIGDLSKLGTNLAETFNDVAGAVNGTGSEEDDDPDEDDDHNFEERSERATGDGRTGAYVGTRTTFSGNSAGLTARIDTDTDVWNTDPTLPAPDAGTVNTAGVAYELFARNDRAAPGEMATLALKLAFDNVDINIDGPIPGQDFSLDLLVAGLTWGFTVVRDVDLDRLVVTELRGTIDRSDIRFSADGNSIVGLEGPTIDVEIPYNTSTTVSFGRVHVANTELFRVPEPPPATLLLLALAWLVARRPG